MKKSLLIVATLLGMTNAALAEEKLVAPAAAPAAVSDEPAEFGSGYNSWGTRGGATLGGGSGARAQLNFGGYGYGGGFGALGIFGVGGYGYAGLEGAYIISLSPDMDVAVGGRLPFWPFGLAPGAQLRYRVMNQGNFQLAIDAGLYVPMYFAGVGVVGTFAIGVSLEPGVMASYFLKDNMEVYFGLIVPIGLQTFTAFGASNFSLFFNMRGGFAYTLKKSNIGFYGNIDLVPGFFAGLNAGGGINGGFGFNFSGGAQFKF
jgi:hypothetical protein